MIRCVHLKFLGDQKSWSGELFRRSLRIDLQARWVQGFNVEMKMIDDTPLAKVVHLGFSVKFKGCHVVIWFTNVPFQVLYYIYI